MDKYEKGTVIYLAAVFAASAAVIIFLFANGLIRTGPGVDINTVDEKMPYSESRYYYNAVDGRLKYDYCALYLALCGFEKECELPYAVTPEEFEILRYMLMYDCPELIQFDKDAAITVKLSKDRRLYRSVKLNYCLSPEKYEEKYRECLGKVKSIAAETDGFDEWEKEKYVYDYVTGSCEYVLEGDETIGNAYGALINGKAKCDGISLAIKWICEDMGIPCYILAGYNELHDAGHVWNVIKIEGTYYDVDATGDTAGEDCEYNLYRAYNVNKNWVRYQYGVRDVLSKYFDLPGSDDMSASYYSENNAFIRWGDDYKELFDENMKSALEKGESGFWVQVANKKVFEDFQNYIPGLMNEWNKEHGKTGIVMFKAFFKYNLIWIEWIFE